MAVKEKIKNYTSVVPVVDSVQNIEKILVANGSTDILKNYNGHSELESISFKLYRHNRHFAFRLPANVHAVAQVMFGTKYTSLDQRKMAQCQRTAWKCIYDWTELQMTMIKLQGADIVQVFLPYMLVGNQTFYHSLQANNFGLLGEKTT